MAWVRNRIPSLVLHAGVVAYVVAMTYLSWVRFEALQAPSFDLGVNLQATYTALHGVPIDMPNYVDAAGAQGPSFFAIHFVPMVYVESPILHLLPPAIALFVIQWAFLGLAAEVLFLIALRSGLGRWLSLGVGGAYLVFPPLLMSGMYDTHFEAAFPLAILLCYYGLWQRRPAVAWGGFALGALSQESFLLLVPFAAIQAYVDAAGGYRPALARLAGTVRAVVRRGYGLLRTARAVGRLGPPDERAPYVAAWIVGPILLFFVELEILQLVAPVRPFLVTSGAGWGISPSNFLLFPAIQENYWIVLIALLGFLPLLGFRRGWMIVPGLVLSLFSSIAGFSEFEWQYTFVPAAGLFVAAIEGLAVLSRLRLTPRPDPVPLGDRKERDSKSSPASRGAGPARVMRGLRRAPLPLAAIAACLVLGSVYSPMLSNTGIYNIARPINTFAPPANYQSVNNLVALVPVTADVLASDFLFAHVATDRNAIPILANYSNGIFTLDNYTPPNWQAEFVLIFPSDFVSAKTLIPSFPAAFGLRATASIPEGEGLGVTLLEYVLLYERAYAGPTSVWSQEETQTFGATDFVTSAGQILPEAYGPFHDAWTIPSGRYGTSQVLSGPSNGGASVDEIPGTLSLEVFVSAAVGTGTSNPQAFRLLAYGAAGPLGSWAVNTSNFSGSKVVDFEVNLTLVDPASSFSIAFANLARHVAVTYYGLRITPVAS